MISLAKFSIRRPRLALAGWALAAGVLIAIGFGVASTMSPSITVISGTASARAQQLATAQFGPSQLVPILLEGRKQALNHVGPRMVVALMKRPHTRVLSAWDAGAASTGLRPKPTAAMIVVSIDRPEKDVVTYDQPAIQRLVTRQIGAARITPYVTGQPSIDRALKDASINDLRRHELIAAGIVFVLLLIGLRAPLAALLVTVKATASMLAAFGEVALLGHFMRLDVIGVAAGSMTGLAIGVGFGLLILDRFHREQLANGRNAKAYVDAAAYQLQTTGRAVLIGGSGLVLALGLVAIVGPTDLMVSVGTAALTSAAFATGAAVVVMPAALVLFGRHIDALTFPAPRLLSRAWTSLVAGGNWVTRHAVFAGFAATVVLAAIAVPALAISTGPPSVKQLPKTSQARIAFEQVARVMGPGWPTPYNIVVTANKGADHRPGDAGTPRPLPVADRAGSPGPAPGEWSRIDQRDLTPAREVRAVARSFSAGVQAEQEGPAEADQRTGPGRSGFREAQGWPGGGRHRRRQAEQRSRRGACRLGRAPQRPDHRQFRIDPDRQRT